MKRIVVPGDLVSAERKRLGSNVFVSDGKVFSKILGIVDDESDTASVVALEGKYFPQAEDTVIGVVSRVVFAGYGVNINSFVESFIPKSAMREELKEGDLLLTKISYVNELREADLEFPRRISGGEVIEIVPVRSPRLIGKSGSMLELLKRGTGCEIVVGKNGRIWARGGNLELLKKVVKFIENNSYKSNLTGAIEGLFGISLENIQKAPMGNPDAPQEQGAERNFSPQEGESQEGDSFGGRSEGFGNRGSDRGFRPRFNNQSRGSFSPRGRGFPPRNNFRSGF